ncbi:MAG TPA: hypothetical protein PLE48_05775 [Thiobacillus sp.]|nr:hypothetical protein [Thiobacillus sp.]HQT34730.1 hypothetical protein [Thiobacillus sp.]HQT69910.1 hypothetical protein [Thiobacillus sp.]
MSAPIIRLGHRHKRLAYATFSLLWVSGALWLAFHYFLGVEGDFGPEPNPLEKWWLRLHGLAAMLALVALGSLLTNHVRLAWQRNKNRRSGLPMLALTAWLAATGYALYYFSSDANAAWLPLLHWTVGLAVPLALTLHILAGRQRAPGSHTRTQRRKKPVLHLVAQPPVSASQKARP